MRLILCLLIRLSMRHLLCRKGWGGGLSGGGGQGKCRLLLGGQAVVQPLQQLHAHLRRQLSDDVSGDGGVLRKGETGLNHLRRREREDTYMFRVQETSMRQELNGASTHSKQQYILKICLRWGNHSRVPCITHVCVSVCR